MATSFQTRTSGGPYFVRTTALGMDDPPSVVCRESTTASSCSGRREQAGRQHDVDQLAGGVRPRPVALQLAREADPADRSCSGLHDTFEAGAVRLRRRSADRVDDREDLESVTQRVERRERETDLGP